MSRIRLYIIGQLDAYVFGQAANAISAAIEIYVVRLSDRVTKYIEAYRGDNFSEKLENLVLDMEERREDLVQDWNRLQAQISDKHHELAVIQDRVKKLREVDRRLQPLADALIDLLRQP